MRTIRRYSNMKLYDTQTSHYVTLAQMAAIWRGSCGSAGYAELDISRAFRGLSPTSTASLHAKSIAVDDRRALVTSANFTTRGQERIVEVGVLVDSENLAGALVHQWRNATEAGWFGRRRSGRG